MITGFSFEKEGFFDFNPNPQNNTDINNNIKVLQQESDNLNELDKSANQRYTDIKQNISDYRSKRLEMQLDNSGNITKYNTAVIPDKTDMVKTTYDVRKEDINTLLLQQNYIYILGSVTCATLLIATIMIGRIRE